jgi:hypothetical protein
MSVPLVFDLSPAEKLQLVEDPPPAFETRHPAGAAGDNQPGEVALINHHAQHETRDDERHGTIMGRVSG